MCFYDLCYLYDLWDICCCYEVLLIFDEIVIGFGCIGVLFVVDYVGVSLDIMCVGKVFIGGYFSLVVILCIVDVVYIISVGVVGVLMYGFIFMVNLLVCVVLVVSVELLFG